MEPLKYPPHIGLLGSWGCNHAIVDLIKYGFAHGLVGGGVMEEPIPEWHLSFPVPFPWSGRLSCKNRRWLQIDRGISEID